DVVKNSLTPKFDETFHWSLEKDEFPKRTLEVIVKNDVSFFSRSKTTMGRAEVKLTSIDLDKGVQKWFTLYDEPDSD
ncbi:hypothetical protein, partial [Salmonella sp. s51933]|uniref:hypothetical protein n=1 Tax=Salmonella sp. s51933 TaxID=3160127 RepID=UPI003754A346